ncbi:oligosaccharide flippase family protein [Cupriavidus basilensis]
MPSKRYFYSFSLKIAQTILGLGLSILLARLLGVSDFGSYSFCLTLVAFVGIFIQIGLPTYLIREISNLRVTENWVGVSSIYRKSCTTTLNFSVCLLIPVAIYLIFNQDGMRGGYYKGHSYLLIFFSLFLVPLLALNRIHESTLQGLDRVFYAQLSDKIFAPLLMMVSVYIWSFNRNLTSQATIIIYAAVLLFVLGLNLWFVNLARPRKIKLNDEKQYDGLPYSNLMPFFLISIVNLVNGQTDMLMLGLFGSPEQVAVYKIAFTWAAFCTFFMTAIDAVIFSKVSGLFLLGKVDELQVLLQNGSRLSFFFAVAVFLFLVVFGEKLVALLYGVQFLPAYPLMLILGVGQLINAFVGSVHGVLNLTHNESYTLKGAIVSAVLNIVLNAVLINKFGVLGAALSSMFTLIFLNTVLLLVLYKRTGLWSAAFPVGLRVSQ